MKILFICGLFCFLFACADEKQSVEKNNSLQGVSERIGDQYATIIQDLQLSEFSEESSRNVDEKIEKSPTRTFISELKDYELSKFDYYGFDLKKFYDDPSEENIQQCMIPSDKMNVVATRGGKTTWRMVIKKEQGKWFAERLSPEYGEMLGWLKDSMCHAGTAKCKIFAIGAREFVTFKKNGRFQYYHITGRSYTPGIFCEYLVEQYKLGQQFLRYKQEHSELFLQMPNAGSE